MTQYLLPYIWLVSLTGFFVVISKKSFGKSLPISLLTTLILMLISGFLKKISYGYYLSILMALTFVIHSLYKLFKSKEYRIFLKEKYLTLGLLIFTLLYIYIMALHNFTTFKYWDEFMHWGVMAKESFRLNTFYSEVASQLQVHKDYPPLTTLMGVLWCKLSGNYYSEPFLFRGLAILTLSFFMPLFEGIALTKENIKKIFVYILLILLVQVIGISDFFPSLTDSIYADYIMGAICSFGIFWIYKSDINDFFDIYGLVIILISLIMVKQMGLPLVLLLVFYLIIKNFRFNKKHLITFIMCLLIPLAFYKIWDTYIGNLGISGQFSLGQINIGNLVSIINKISDKPYQSEAFYNFLKALVNKSVLDYPIKLNYIFSILILGILIFIVEYKNKNKFTYTLTFTLGAIGYALAMHLLYIFSFNDYEGPLLASYERYMGTYVYMGFVLLVYILLDTWKNKKPRLIEYLLSLLVIFSFVMPKNASKLLIKTKYEGYLTKEGYKDLFYYIDSNKIDYSNILIISQYYSDIEVVARYSYLFNNFEAISLGPSKYYDDITTLDISHDAFKDMLNKYDYIYIFNSDDLFYNDFWTKITSEELINYRMYKINKEDGVTITPIY